jgi:hypothetical protein
MEGINFGWLAVWVLSPDWIIRKLKVCDFSDAYVKPPRLWGGVCGTCLDFASYTLGVALQLRKITENLRVTEKRSADHCRKRFL